MSFVKIPRIAVPGPSENATKTDKKSRKYDHFQRDQLSFEVLVEPIVEPPLNLEIVKLQRQHALYVRNFVDLSGAKHGYDDAKRLLKSKLEAFGMQLTIQPMVIQPKNSLPPLYFHSDANQHENIEETSNYERIRHGSGIVRCCGSFSMAVIMALEDDTISTLYKQMKNMEDECKNDDTVIHRTLNAGDIVCHDIVATCHAVPKRKKPILVTEVIHVDEHCTRPIHRFIQKLQAGM